MPKYLYLLAFLSSTSNLYALGSFDIDHAQSEKIEAKKIKLRQKLAGIEGKEKEFTERKLRILDTINTNKNYNDNNVNYGSQYKQIKSEEISWKKDTGKFIPRFDFENLSMHVLGNQIHILLEKSKTQEDQGSLFSLKQNQGILWKNGKLEVIENAPLLLISNTKRKVHFEVYKCDDTIQITRSSGVKYFGLVAQGLVRYPGQLEELERLAIRAPRFVNNGTFKAQSIELIVNTLENNGHIISPNHLILSKPGVTVVNNCLIQVGGIQSENMTYQGPPIGKMGNENIASENATDHLQIKKLYNEKKLLNNIFKDINLKNYEDIGLHHLHKAGYFGQDITIAVIEGGFHHTISPEYRCVNNPHVKSTKCDFESQYSHQVLKPLEFYDSSLAPLSYRYESSMGRGISFRYSHGDDVLSQIADAAPLAKILPVAVHFGQDGSFVAALESLSENDNVHIINMSRWLEAAPGDECRLNDRVRAALQRCAKKGKIIVLSAGNASRCIPNEPIKDSQQLTQVNYLAANLITDLFYNLPSENPLWTHVIISGALAKERNILASYSNMAGSGPAMGVFLSTKGFHHSRISDSVSDGTSMSAPYTTAAVALLLSAFEGVKGHEVVQALLSSADLQWVSPNEYGRGILKVHKAYSKLSGKYKAK